MTLLATAILVLGSQTFQGGKDRALAGFVAKRFDAPVAILADPARTWPKFTIPDNATEDNALRALRVRAGTTTFDTQCAGFGAAAWPKNFYLTRRRDQYAKAGKPGKRPTYAGGKITAATGDTVDLTDAFPGEFPIRVSWHWFYQDARLVIEARAVKPDNYVKLIARAIGAKVVKTASGFYLDFDPAEYRRRGVTLLDDLAEKRDEDVLLAEDYIYSSKVLAHLTDSQLSTYMAAPDKVTFVPGPMTGEVREAALKRLKRFFPVEDDDIKRSGSATSAWQSLRDEVDFDRLYIAFYARGTMATLMKARRAGHPDRVF